MYQKTTLDNNLRVITAEMPHTRSATVTVFVGAGSRYEPDTIAGISHFIEHMVFKGTVRRPNAREISEEVEGVGGVLNAGTDRELTVYWAKVPRPAFERTVDLLVDMVRHSLFEPAELEKERKVIIEELSMVHDSPQQLVDLLIDEVIWPDQPLGRDVAGTKESVGGITRDQQLGYLAEHYGPGNTVISVAGNVDHNQVVDLVGSLLQEWRPVSPRLMLPAVNGQTAPRVKVRTKKTEEAHLCVAYPGLDNFHPDRFALDLLNVIFGEGMSSRLFQEIREKRGLAYDVHSYVSRFQDSGAVTVYAGVDPKQIDETVRVVVDEFERFRSELVSDHEFTKAKELIKGRLLLRLEDTRAVASSFGNQELLLNRILTVDDIVGIVEQVQPADLMRVADQLFRREHINLAVVGNFRSEDRFQRLVR